MTTVSVGAFGFFNKNRDLDIKMIEIALGILREDPKESNITAAREWAVSLLDRYSGEPLSEAARSELLDRPLEIDLKWSSMRAEFNEGLLRQASEYLCPPGANPGFTPEDMTDSGVLLWEEFCSRFQPRSNISK